MGIAPVGAFARRSQLKKSVLLLLLSQQFALALDPPTVARKVAIAAYDAMARHNHRHRVCRTGACNSAKRICVTNLGRDLAVAACLASWNTLQRFPNLSLEVRRAYVERKINRQALASQTGEQGLHVRLEGRVIAHDGCCVKFAAKLA